MVCSRWVVRYHSSQYPCHWMMSAAPLRCRKCVRYRPRTALSSPVLSLRVSCDDYLSMRPTCEVPPRGSKERVFWGTGAPSTILPPANMTTQALHKLIRDARNLCQTHSELGERWHRLSLRKWCRWSSPPRLAC